MGRVGGAPESRGAFESEHAPGLRATQPRLSKTQAAVGGGRSETQIPGAFRSGNAARAEPSGEAMSKLWRITALLASPAFAQTGASPLDQALRSIDALQKN